MGDTSPAMDARYHALLRALPPERRLQAAVGRAGQCDPELGARPAPPGRHYRTNGGRGFSDGDVLLCH